MVCSNPFARARLFDLDNIFCSKDLRAFLAYRQIVQDEEYPGQRPFVAALFFDHSLRGLYTPHCGHLRVSMLDCTLSGVEAPCRAS